jgi:hypothetical protein
MFNFDRDIKNIKGWLTEDEGHLLYNLAKKASSNQVIVEIGSWKGKSTICLGNGSKDGNHAKVYAIDPHIGSSEHQKMFGHVDTFIEFLHNIKNAGIAKYILPIRKTSEDAASDFNNPVVFIFIDGAHEFKFVYQDFTLWFPKVTIGGIIAFHDTWHFLGANFASAIFLLTSSHIRNPRLVDTITYFEKVEKNSIADRIENVYFIFYRMVVGIDGFLKLKYQTGKNI